MSKNPTIKKIPLKDVIYDLSLQMRVRVDGDHVNDLAEALENGEELPPIKVWPEGDNSFMGDGNHTYLAHKQKNKRLVNAEIHEGGRKEALKYALSANNKHNALKRTKADKQKAVAEGHEHFPDLSVREMAKLCAVSPSMVQAYRENLKKCTLSTPSEDDPEPSAGPQLTFFDRFAAPLNEACKHLEELCNFSDLMDLDIPKEEKLKAIELAESNISTWAKKLKERKTQIAKSV